LEYLSVKAKYESNENLRRNSNHYILWKKAAQEALPNVFAALIIATASMRPSGEVYPMVPFNEFSTTAKLNRGTLFYSTQEPLHGQPRSALYSFHPF
jgi:hypothetical protein